MGKHGKRRGKGRREQAQWRVQREQTRRRARMKETVSSNTSKTTIVVTDADNVAARTVQRVAERIGAEVVSESAGNPTHARVEEVIEAIEVAEAETVIVMADDNGDSRRGPGEKLIKQLHEEYHVDAAIAVASNCTAAEGVKVDESVTQDGRVVPKAVDKKGKPVNSRVVVGDTVDVLNEIEVPVVGVGDVGKAPRGRKGDQVLEKAIEEAQRLAESGSQETTKVPSSNTGDIRPTEPAPGDHGDEQASEPRKSRSSTKASRDESEMVSQDEGGKMEEVVTKAEYEDAEMPLDQKPQHQGGRSKKGKSGKKGARAAQDEHEVQSSIAASLSEGTVGSSQSPAA